MLLIKNATIINPKPAGLQKADLLIENDKIIKIQENIEPASLWGAVLQVADTEFEVEKAVLQVVDAEGLFVGPGLIDVHVHFRDPGFTYKEDIYTGARAAAKGGFTTVVLMANTKPAVDNEETLSYVLQKGKETGIHVETCAAVTKSLAGEELTDMSLLKEKGAVGFTDDGIPILNQVILREAMQKAADLAVPISLHEEDPAFISENGVNAGAAAAHFGIGGSDRQAEIILSKRDMEIALETGAVLNIQHISSAEAVENVRKAKAKGNNIHAEATPHHFSLTEEAVLTHGTMAKMNPPLRTEQDRLAIIEGIKDGTIDIIATDHAPHSREEKSRSITQAPSGIIGLETAFSLAVTNLVKAGHIDLVTLFDRMSYAPAKLYHFDRGYIAEGGPADLVIFHPDEEMQYREFISKSQNSPFLGAGLQGKIHCTICNGKIVYKSE